MPDYDHGYDHELEIIGEDGWTDYYFEAIGFVSGEQVNSHDEIGDKHVKGKVGGSGSDVIAFNSAPKGVSFPDRIGEYRLELDGQEVEPFHLNARTLTIETPADMAPYEFAVSGRVIGTGSNQSTEYIFGDGQRARGRVTTAADEWHFSGCLTAWPDSNQPLKVTVDEKVYEYDGNAPVGTI